MFNVKLTECDHTLTIFIMAWVLVQNHTYLSLLIRVRTVSCFNMFIKPVVQNKNV